MCVELTEFLDNIFNMPIAEPQTHLYLPCRLVVGIIIESPTTTITTTLSQLTQWPFKPGKFFVSGKIHISHSISMETSYSWFHMNKV